MTKIKYDHFQNLLKHPYLIFTTYHFYYSLSYKLVCTWYMVNVPRQYVEQGCLRLTLSDTESERLERAVTTLLLQRQLRGQRLL